MPTDYEEVLKSLDRKGDFKAGVLKVNIPRNDLKMTIQGVATPTPFGFGGWVALTKGADGSEVIPVQKKVHSLTVDSETHRVYAPEQEADGKAVTRMIVYEALVR